MLASAGEYLDVESALAGKPVAELQVTGILTNAVALFMADRMDVEGMSSPHLRMAQLPCIKAGLEEGVQALKGLVLPFLSLGADPAARIKSACRRHPEALLPFFAATILEARPATPLDKPGAAVRTQAELYHLAASLPSVLPKLPRLARLNAVERYFDLATNLSPASPDARQFCVGHLRAAAQDEQSSAAECQEDFGRALGLREFDLARELPAAWERRAPASEETLRRRIELERLSGAYGRALDLLDKFLADDPGDGWAVEQRRAVLEAVRTLANSAASLERLAK
ncbi:MAG: hypothetical protein HYY24_20930 [Verrucomicrobia bacterium]|nr:hypothetical protein [Verrucomicrobiota bacterium]